MHIYMNTHTPTHGHRHRYTDTDTQMHRQSHAMRQNTHMYIDMCKRNKYRYALTLIHKQSHLYNHIQPQKYTHYQRYRNK